MKTYRSKRLIYLNFVADSSIKLIFFKMNATKITPYHFITSELLTYTYTDVKWPNGPWGCVDCLKLDQKIGLDAEIIGKPLSVALIDYELAYDRVPHKWVMKVLKTIKCLGKIWRSIELFSKHWATVFELRLQGR